MLARLAELLYVRVGAHVCIFGENVKWPKVCRVETRRDSKETILEMCERENGAW